MVRGLLLLIGLGLVCVLEAREVATENEQNPSSNTNKKDGEASSFIWKWFGLAVSPEVTASSCHFNHQFKLHAREEQPRDDLLTGQKWTVQTEVNQAMI